MVWLAAIAGLEAPVPAECSDPIEGTWVGIERRPHGWLAYQVDVSRTGASSLSGTIRGHVWLTDHRSPPPCTGQHEEYIAHQPATGTFDAGRFDFRAPTVSRIESRCGSDHRYLADHLTGVSSGPSTMDVISDDGGAPPSRVILTRVSCEPHHGPST